MLATAIPLTRPATTIAATYLSNQVKKLAVNLRLTANFKKSGRVARERELTRRVCGSWA